MSSPDWHSAPDAEPMVIDYFTTIDDDIGARPPPVEGTWHIVRSVNGTTMWRSIHLE